VETVPPIVADIHDWVMPNLLRQRASELGDAPYLSFAIDDASVTYREADERSDRLAAGLARLGVKHGECVLMMLENRLEFVLAWFALNKLGAYHAPVNTDYRGDFLEHLANITQARIMVVSARHLDVVLASQERMPHLKTLIVVAGEEGVTTGRFDALAFEELPADEEPPTVDVRHSDIYSVMFTSGTTGRSKGALMPYAHGHLLNERNLGLLDMDRDSLYITELPLFHINAHMAVYCSLIVGGRTRLEERFSATRWLDRLRETSATHSSMLGVMVDFVLQQPPTDHDRDHSLRSVWMVPALPDLADRFRDRFGIERIVTSYGTSETGMVSRRVVEHSATNVGGAVSWDLYDVQVVDDNDDPLPTGKSGQILVRKKLPWTVTPGYLGMPERTVEAFQNLWFHTGDIGRFDEAGNLNFVDRVADRIRRRGENVASADVEHVIMEHAFVAEAAVVAVSADEEGGEDEIKACVVLDGDGELDVEAFWVWCDERLPYFAIPRYIHVFDELPKTPTAKVIKAELRAATGGQLYDRGPTGRRARA
jgi:crotonobetaine/carnitine-CoA ligase